MNFGFYNIVLIIAVVILILTLTYIGIQMRNKVKTSVYPPMVAACPDYWEQSLDGKGCIIPNITEKNAGNSAFSTTKGFYNDEYGNQCINFNDPAWKARGNSICAKQTWANTNGIVWDGVTNYNQSC
jgi:hypothetical protein